VSSIEKLGACMRCMVSIVANV